MRPLEYLFIASLLLAAASYFVAPARRSDLLTYAPHIALSVALAHGLVEGGRWSLYLAYAAAAIMAIVAIGRLRDEPGPDRRWARWIGGSLVVIVTLASAAAAWLFPVFSLPAPTGTYQIGTKWIVLTDSARAEDLTSDAGDRRRVVVRLWFPADSVAGSASEYSERAVARATARALGLPGFVLSHLPLVDTHSHERAQLSRAVPQWPLLLFSHGYGSGTESQNTVQMEELASHGFVVASIDHLYEAGAVVLPGGTLATFVAPASYGDTTFLARTTARLARVRSAPDTTALRAAVRDMQALQPSLDTSMTRWTDDTRFVLDRLTTMSAPQAQGDTLMVGRLATDRVGVFGMSFGGASAANFCTIDPRCAAGLNFDGLTYGTATNVAMPRPFFFAASDGNARMHELFYERAVAPAYAMTVRGSTHLDYTDVGLISPLLHRFGVVGTVPKGQMQQIMNAVTLSFFGAYLRGGAPVDVVALRQRFPELTLEARIGAAVPPDTIEDASRAGAAEAR